MGLEVVLKLELDDWGREVVSELELNECEQELGWIW